MKGFIKGKPQAQFNPPVVLKELPPSTTAIPKELYDATYDQEEKPGPLPPGVTLEKLKQLEEMIPNRSNNKQLTDPGAQSCRSAFHGQHYGDGCNKLCGQYVHGDVPATSETWAFTSSTCRCRTIFKA